MTVSEIIEQIKALPASEQEKVAAFVRDLASSVVREEPGATYIPVSEASELSQRIFTENEELFRKLAQ